MLPEQQQRIMGYFIEEAKDHLNTIEQGLLSLQITIKDPEKANELFRAAHSVKGGAAMLGLESVQTTAHRMEDYFKILKESPVQVDSALETMFLRISDGLKDLLEQLEGPFGLTPEKSKEIMSEIDPIFGQLEKHLGHLVASSRTNSLANDKEESKEEDIQNRFKSDVSVLLRQLLATFKQPDTAESRLALQEICLHIKEVGEQFDLNEWCDLSETARLTVSNRDNDYRVLAPIVIKAFKKSQDLVLAGRASEVAVSDTMQSLLPEDLLATAHESTAEIPIDHGISKQDISSQKHASDQTEEDFEDTTFDINFEVPNLSEQSEFELETEGLFETASSTMAVEQATSEESSSLDDIFGFDAESVELSDELSMFDLASSSDTEPTTETQTAAASELDDADSRDIEDLTLEPLSEEPTSRISIDLDFNEIPSELSALNRDAKSEEQVDESLDALLATVNVTGPSVGEEELNSLADLFDGDLEELDNTLGGHPFVSEEMRLHPERIDMDEEDDFTDFLSGDDSLDDLLEHSSDKADQSEEFDEDLFGGTLTEGGFADSATLDWDDVDLESPAVDNESSLLGEGLETQLEESQVEKALLNERTELLQNLSSQEEKDKELAEEIAELNEDLWDDTVVSTEANYQTEISLEDNFLDNALFEEEIFEEETSEESGFKTEENKHINSEAASLKKAEVVTPTEQKEENLLEDWYLEETSTEALPMPVSLFSEESVSPSEQDIEFPTLTGHKLKEAEEDIDSFFGPKVEQQEVGDTSTNAEQSQSGAISQDADTDLFFEGVFSEEDLVGDQETESFLEDLVVEETLEASDTFPAQQEDSESSDVPFFDAADKPDLLEAKADTTSHSTSDDALDALLEDIPQAEDDISLDLEGFDDRGLNVDELNIDELEISELEIGQADLGSLDLNVSSIEDFATDNSSIGETTGNSTASVLGENFESQQETLLSEISTEGVANDETTVQTNEETIELDDLLDLNTELESSELDDDELKSDDRAESSQTGKEEATEESDSASTLDDLFGAESETTELSFNNVELGDLEDEFNLGESVEESGVEADSTQSEGELDIGESVDIRNTQAEETCPTLGLSTNDAFDEDEALDATVSTLDGASDITVQTIPSAESVESSRSVDIANESGQGVNSLESNHELEEATLAEDFDDLEALLADTDAQANPTVEDSTSQPTFSRSVRDSVHDTPTLIGLETSTHNHTEDEDFGDLERLLEDGEGENITAIAPRRVAPRAARRSGMREQNMRVSVKHLDTLSNLVGELVVSRNTLERDQERLRQFLDNLLFQVQQLNDVGQRMRDLYERSLLESSLISSRKSYAGENKASEPEDHATGATFDALEMDRFTGFHTLSQEMIELIVRVRESSSDIGYTVESSDQATRQFRQITTQLQEGLNTARMVAFSQAADRLPRAVRDISLKCGKEARLVVEGKDTLIDKMIVEHLYDPLTHLVNNAITHGIETPEERKTDGKPTEGTITVQAFYQGNQTVIYVADDGGGINPTFVQQKAVQKGLISQAEANELSDIETYELLFHPGFSTRDQADDFAGRGVGMDVVRTSLAEIRGAITIDSEQGKGTSFTIRLPLTLSISKALSCVSNQARIAFPMDGVEDMLDVSRDRLIKDDQGRDCVRWRDRILPFQAVTDLLKFNRTLGRGRVYGGSQDDDVLSIIVLRSANTFVAIQVDQVIGEEEIVIKQLEGPVPKPLGIAGATILGDGRVMPIADVIELIDIALGRVRKEPSSLLWTEEPEVEEEEAAAKTDPTVLIVDDSITVRELLSMSFNKVGYRVEQARDGQEAWDKLRSGLPCDLVFCDIEMPRMDGLELLSRMQKDNHLKQVPIAMLTSRGADRHRQMAVDLGASGYFTKPYLEEALLDAAQRMLNGETLEKGRGG